MGKKRENEWVGMEEEDVQHELNPIHHPQHQQQREQLIWPICARSDRLGATFFAFRSIIRFVSFLAQ